MVQASALTDPCRFQTTVVGKSAPAKSGRFRPNSAQVRPNSARIRMWPGLVQFWSDSAHTWPNSQISSRWAQVWPNSPPA